MDEQTINHDFRFFRYTKEEVKREFAEPCFQRVINTDAFRRLESIHFLGSIDFLLSGPKNGVEQRHTRYEHSLAVAGLAKRFAQTHDLPSSDYEKIVISALLHDIGHAPLSHSLEPSFKGLFEIDHHVIGERILRGEVKLGVRLAKEFERCQINNFDIMAIISGFGDGAAKDLFSRSINVDTIEGILRSASYIYRKGVVQDPAVVIDAFASLSNSATGILDEFWLTKGRIYAELIQSPKGLMADYICKRYIENNSANFELDYYYGTEQELRRRHAALFIALEDFGRANILPPFIRNGEKFTFTKREFYIDSTVKLKGYADIDRRYLQTKSKQARFIKKTGGDDAHAVQKYPKSESLF